MSKQNTDNFIVTMELDEASCSPGPEELALIEAGFGDLIKLVLAELASQE